MGWVLAVIAIAGAGCGDRADQQAGAGGVSGSLTVFAAASLTEAFTELGEQFEIDHPEAAVTFNFGASSALARQILDGSPADVFAAADDTAMAAVADAGLVAAPELLARNRLEILVAKGNPKEIAGLADLDQPGIVVVLCAPEVPCGRLAAATLQRAGVAVAAASLEENVKAVVSRVTLGEADAGIVYVTDSKAAGDSAEGVPIDTDVEAAYPIAVTKVPHNPAAARAWVAFVLGGEGQAVLRQYGFRSP